MAVWAEPLLGHFWAGPIFPVSTGSLCPVSSGSLLVPRSWGPRLAELGAAGRLPGVVPWLKEVTVHRPCLFISCCGHGVAAPGSCGGSALFVGKAAGCGQVCPGAAPSSLFTLSAREGEPGELRTWCPGGPSAQVERGLWETGIPALPFSGNVSFLPSLGLSFPVCDRGCNNICPVGQEVPVGASKMAPLLDREGT